MPQVKIDHIVSFSSEDPGRPAKSLCNSGIGVGWRGSVSERTSSVVCGLQRAVHISSVTVGVVNVALLEVLVGRSAQPDHYEVLVPRSVVVPPLESRRGGGGDRVRTWGGEGLNHQTRGQLWDRIKLVCSQPYDKQAQFGISFVHVFSPEEAGENSTSAGKQEVRGTVGGALGEEQEEEEFTPGELWRRHTSTLHTTHTNTDAQIRQATSQALKNVPSETHTLVKTTLNKEKRTSNSHTSEQKEQRDRDDLMYDSDDDKPNDKIDNAVNKHRKKKERDKQHKDQLNTSTKDKQSNRNERDNKCEQDGNKGKERHKEKKEDEIKHCNDRSRSVDKKRDMKRRSEERSSSSTVRDTQIKRTKRDESRNKTERGDSGPPLSGVVFAISGYVHPRRGNLRGAAVRLGALYRTDVSDHLTHLLAAYHNTPKVRAAAPGTVVVLGEWIDECVRRGERMDPGPYLTDPKQRTRHTDTPGPKPVPPRRRSPSSGSDTDDDIQRALHTGGTGGARGTESGGASRGTESEVTTRDTSSEGTGEGDDTRGKEREGETKDEEDVTEFTGDNILKCNWWSSDDSAAGDTEEELEPEELETGRKTGELPDLLEGKLVRVRGGRADLLRRYVTGYGGTLAHESSCEDADVYVCGEGGVTPSWVWDLHSNKQLPTTEPYLINGD